MSSAYQPLFESLALGSVSIPNRFVMAPLTRSRASIGHVPNDLMAEYYKQRATAGLIITEATMVEEGNSAFISEPGIYNQEQVAGWRKITEAVHNQGGRIFLQLWHGGRACHPDLNQGNQTVAPSPIAIQGEVYTKTGKATHVTPRAIEDHEIPKYIGLFKRGAELALAANFDGVEVHGANGYLIDQFLRSSANHRSGPYGGSLQNRAKFLLEVVQEVTSVWGADRVGVRLSPLNSYNSMKDEDPIGLMKYVSRELDRFQLSYLHIMRSDFFGLQRGPVIEAARDFYRGALIGNMGYTAQEAANTIRSGLLQAVAFGHDFISNPDLVARIQNNRALAKADEKTFYTPGPKGYIDYPAL